MENYKNVLYCSVSYRRNIKDMPFVKLLTDTEQAIGVTRSMSEILGDDFEFKALKNLPLFDCKLLEEDGIISSNLIDNKDISAYGKNLNSNLFIYINEEDHIRIKAVSNGYNLEKCYNNANAIDDKILEKLEMCFNTDFGYLTSNPMLCGTGMQLEVCLFLPALIFDKKLNKIKNEIEQNNFELVDLLTQSTDKLSAFVVLRNKYTFGLKENEFAEILNKMVKRIVELETLEESKLFDFSASNLVDKIYKNYGIAKNAYRLTFEESVEHLGFVLWGINLKVLNCVKQFDILENLCKIKECHLNNTNLNIKEVEKLRAKKVAVMLDNVIKKGDVDV